MKKIICLICLFLSIYHCGFSQKKLIELSIHDKKIGEFIDHERKMDSKKIDKENLSINMDYEHNQTIVYLRKERVIPNLLVYYTFQKKDSVMLEILYEWDVYNFDQHEDNKKSLDFDKALTSKYQNLTKLISSKYGRSQTKGDLVYLPRLNGDVPFQRIDIWKTYDSSKIFSYIYCSNYYKKTDSETIIPSHKIRVYITNLEGEKTLN